jgi:hypothetical protein
MGTPVDGNFPMGGFVANYAGADGARCLSLENPPPVMGYFTGSEAPITDFFCAEFCSLRSLVFLIARGHAAEPAYGDGWLLYD